ncbi:hypothetical protein M885DRAFT_437377 [Pelagophyceae sp. CCMP2097]|nr:hypothetical protein M885DRAFT_437377 [Pelagophyceae sp. CCMP2097]
MCLCFFSGDPVEGDSRAGRLTMFKAGMMKAPCKDPGMFCLSFICFPCVNCYIRSQALEDKMENYQCCQGYYDCMCFKAGTMGDQGSVACLLCEGCCCHACAVSSTRNYLMDKYDLASDPWDNRIIRFNNFMQLLSCICDIIALFDASFRDLAQCIRFVANIVYCCTAGCMNAQAHYELQERKKEGTLAGTGPAAPAAEHMAERPATQPPGGEAKEPPLATVKREFVVVVPDGVKAGSTLVVMDPNGKQVQFAVPPNAPPGSQLTVPY